MSNTNIHIASTQIAEAGRLPATFAGGSYNALSCSMPCAGVFAPAAVYVAATRLRCAAGVGLPTSAALVSKCKKPFQFGRVIPAFY